MKRKAIQDPSAALANATQPEYKHVIEVTHSSPEVDGVRIETFTQQSARAAFLRCCAEVRDEYEDSAMRERGKVKIDALFNFERSMTQAKYRVRLMETNIDGWSEVVWRVEVPR